MVERCGIAMIITDHNLDILFSNSHFQDIIQKTQHINIKKKKQYNLLNFLDPISQTSIKRFTTQTINGLQTQELEISIVNQDGINSQLPTVKIEETIGYFFSIKAISIIWKNQPAIFFAFKDMTLVERQKFLNL
jgi:hypothetical protein